MLWNECIIIGSSIWWQVHDGLLINMTMNGKDVDANSLVSRLPAWYSGLAESIGIVCIMHQSVSTPRGHWQGSHKPPRGYWQCSHKPPRGYWQGSHKPPRGYWQGPHKPPRGHWQGSHKDTGDTDLQTTQGTLTWSFLLRCFSHYKSWGLGLRGDSDNEMSLEDEDSDSQNWALSESPGSALGEVAGDLLIGT